MTPTHEGSFRLFRAAGINVFVHWSWLIVAFYEFQTRTRLYSSPIWNVWEYLALFGIVLLHEFGHALACRQVGGRADQIVLWPLGGVAYVAPPPRPGAVLWSIAAGPLVNVALIPILFLVTRAAHSGAWASGSVLLLLKTVSLINWYLLIFNILPIYPLDGGQMLRSLIWFRLGPVRSLFIATSIGFAGVALIVWWAIQAQSIFLGAIAAFIFMNCFRAWQEARAAMQERGGF